MWHDLFSAFCFAKIFPQSLDCVFIQRNFVFLLRITWTEFLKTYFAIRSPVPPPATLPPLPRLPCPTLEEHSFSIPAPHPPTLFQYMQLYGTQGKAQGTRKLCSDFPFNPQTYAGLDYLHSWGVFSSIPLPAETDAVTVFPSHFQWLPQCARVVGILAVLWLRL